MIKTIVVDDDHLARIGIINSINWTDYNIEIVYDTANGIEALEYIKSHEVDLAFLDLEMPSMFGLELLKNIKVDSKSTNCVIITMHSDFKYIQEALRLGVLDYIIKTDFVDGEELKESISRIEKRILFNKKGSKEINDCIEKAIDLICMNMNKYYSASEMAKEVNISRSYFSTCFKQVTGKNFNEYVKNIKIEEGKKLLENSMTVYEVSKNLGFNNEKYFSTIFKNITGYTPSDYKKVFSKE